jgi:hypothetical protein
MIEWWTYRPSDFLMFSARTWWRLFELHNAAAWPLPLLLLLGSAVLLVLVQRPAVPTAVLRMALALLALAWAGVAWFFLWQRFAPIHWPAPVYAIAFAVQAAALLALAGRADLGVVAGGRRRRAGLILGWVALAYPLVAPLSGRPWAQAEVIALAPDPTALATLAVLLLAEPAAGFTKLLATALRIGASAWLLLSAATLFTMASPQGALPLAAAMLACWAARQPPRTQRNPM